MIGRTEESRTMWRRIARKLWAPKKLSVFEYQAWAVGLAIQLAIFLAVPLATETKTLLLAINTLWFLYLAHLPDQDIVLEATTVGIGFLPLMLFSSGHISTTGLPFFCIGGIVWWAIWLSVNGVAVKRYKDLKNRNMTHHATVLCVSLACLESGILVVVLSVFF
jgi:hypothetical protein